MRHRHLSLVAAFSAAAGLATAFALSTRALAGEGMEPRPVSVIPPGHEAEMAAMLGGDEMLAGHCVWDGASIESTWVRARYLCAGQQVYLSFREPQEKTPGDVVTAQFAISVMPGAPAPPALVPSVAARIRAREGSWHWMKIAPDIPGKRSHRRRALALSILSALPATALAALAWALFSAQKIRRLRPAAVGPARATKPGDAMTGVVVALMLIVSAAVCVRALMVVAAFALVAQPLSSLLGAGLPLLLAPLAFLIGCFFLSRLRPGTWARRGTGIGCLLVLCLYGLSYARSIAPEAPEAVATSATGNFFGLKTQTPLSETIGDGSIRPKVHYRNNRYGLRGPEISLLPPQAGTVRIAIIGDSFVYGSGVELEDTLGEQLRGELARRFPTTPLEVINLGVPGNNLASHIDMYRIAQEQLSPQAIILCLTLPNDLSRWDTQSERNSALRPGPFSLLRHALGPAAASALAGYFFIDDELTDENLAHFKTETDRLFALRAGHEKPPLLVFTYGYSAGDIRSRFTGHPGIFLAPLVAMTAADRISGDGHPSATGNRRFAPVLAATLEGTADFLIQRQTFPPPQL